MSTSARGHTCTRPVWERDEQTPDVTCLAQQFSAQVELATSPHQYALKIKVGCETVAHILQVLTELDEEATVVSVDGIGAFDLISRNAMMSGLSFMVDVDRLLPFVRAFYGQPSSYIWEDDAGEVHSIPQGEGGEQGDPVMPLLFCLGQHSALRRSWQVYGREKHCSRTWTTSTWSANQTGWEQSTTSSVSICGTNAEFPSTQGRPSCGTKVPPTHPIAPDCSARQRTSLQRQWCGEGTPTGTLINRDSRCLEFLLDTQRTSNGFLRRRLRTTVCCWIGFPQSMTRSRRGSSCPFALQPDPVSSCAPSSRRRRTNSQSTTVVCGGVCARFCPFFQVAVQKIRPGCHCGKEALDSGAHNERNPPHGGRHKDGEGSPPISCRTHRQCIGRRS